MEALASQGGAHRACESVSPGPSPRWTLETSTLETLQICPIPGREAQPFPF